MNTRANIPTVSLLIYSLLTVGLSQSVKAQASQAESRKWEYCAITDSFGTGTKDKPYGIVVITFFEEASYREESIRVDLDPKGVQASEVYEITRKKAFAKAFAQLGDDEWELVGSIPFVKRFGSDAEDKTGIYFKRLKRQ